jgi:DMSO/TMAO reductase YedYZ molybdopterin-dependent catalytic subunit
MIKSSKNWLMIMALVLGAVLTVSCGPVIGLSNPDQGRGESDQVELAPSESAGGQEQIEPSVSQPSEEPKMDVPTQLSQVILSDPAKIDNSRLPITSVEQLNLTGVAPDVNIEQYRLVIDGLVETPLSLTYEEILACPSVTEVVLLICPGFFADNAEWTGVPVTALLEKAGIKPEAKTVVFQDISGSYRRELPLEDITGNGSIFLAHTVDGQTLPLEHGYPLRLVAKGKYGSYWVKWVERIEVQ